MAGDGAGLAAAPVPAPKVNTLLLLLPAAPKALAPLNWKPENTAKMKEYQVSQPPSWWDVFLKTCINENISVQIKMQFPTLARRGSRCSKSRCRVGLLAKHRWSTRLRSKGRSW